MSLLTNKWPGRCGCGVYVQPRAGYVHARKITCIQCVPIEPMRPRGSEFEYQGCGPTEEHLSEWFLDHFENESHFVGWEVGAQ